jgi:hypothetical protein
MPYTSSAGLKGSLRPQRPLLPSFLRRIINISKPYSSLRHLSVSKESSTSTSSSNLWPTDDLPAYSVLDQSDAPPAYQCSRTLEALPLSAIDAVRTRKALVLMERREAWIVARERYMGSI